MIDGIIRLSFLFPLPMATTTGAGDFFFPVMIERMGH
jgi:hypothetical protein